MKIHFIVKLNLRDSEGIPKIRSSSRMFLTTALISKYRVISKPTNASKEIVSVTSEPELLYKELTPNLTAFPLFTSKDVSASNPACTSKLYFMSSIRIREFNLVLNLPVSNPVFIISYGLAQNFPNPFNPTTRIAFKLTTENAENAVLKIYNSKGQLVKVFTNLQTNGSELGSVTWNGDDEKGNAVSSGIYLYKLKANNEEYNKKMIMIK